MKACARRCVEARRSSSRRRCVCSGSLPDFAGDYWLQIALSRADLSDARRELESDGGLGRARFARHFVFRRPRRLCRFWSAQQLGAPLPLALVGCAIAGGALAALVSPALFRLRGLYFTVGTLALAELLRLDDGQCLHVRRRDRHLPAKDPPPLPVLFHYALSVALVASLVITACTRTRVSVILRAVRDDEDAAAQMGVRPYRVKLAAFVLASALVAMAGGVQAVKLGAIEPYGMFGLQWSIDVLSMVIIGGVGLRLGPLVGAVFVVALGEALADYPEAHVAIAGVILIVLIRFAPRGVVGFAAESDAFPDKKARDGMSAKRRRSSKSRASSSAMAASWRSTTSTCSCSPARSPASSARMARESRR